MSKVLEERLKVFVSSSEVKNSIDVQTKTFGAAVSNPPYQKETGNGSIAIYHHFMNVAKVFSKNISMIYPSRWIIGGRGEGVEDFRTCELQSKHYKTFIIDSDEAGVFENNSIKGGVNYFHWTRKVNDKVHYIYNNMFEERKTLINEYEIMVVDPRFSNIVKKVKPVKHITVMPRNYYGIHLETDQSIEKLSLEVPEKQRLSTIGTEDLEHFTRIYYSSNKGGVYTTVIPKNAGKHSDEKYKLMASRTADPDRKNNTLRRQNRLFILKPGEICGGSFLQVGTYNTEESALNALRYMKTVFAMFMFGVITPVPSTVRNNYRLIPDVDFETGFIKDSFDSEKNELFRLDFEEKHELLTDQICRIYKIDDEEYDLMEQSVKKWDNSIPSFGYQIAKTAE